MDERWLLRETHTHLSRASLVDTAGYDQKAAYWRDALDYIGVNLADPETARVAFTLCALFAPESSVAAFLGVILAREYVTAAQIAEATR